MILLSIVLLNAITVTLFLLFTFPSKIEIKHEPPVFLLGVAINLAIFYPGELVTPEFGWAWMVSIPLSTFAASKIARRKIARLGYKLPTEK